MSEIVRRQAGSRMSQSVTHNGTVWLAGQVSDAGPSVAEQTQGILDKIDGLLAEAGSSKSRLLQVTIWLADMADFAEMNAVWDAWIDPANPPARACGESALARPEIRVEIIAVAATG